MLIVIAVDQVDGSLVDVKSQVNVLIPARRLKHLSVLLESLGILIVESCQPMVSDQSLVRLIKLSIEITNLLHNLLFIQTKLDCFIETEIGLRKTLQPSGQAKNSHHSPNLRIDVIDQVGLRDSILSLLKLVHLEQ